jgi:hypothetical protein
MATKFGRQTRSFFTDVRRTFLLKLDQRSIVVYIRKKRVAGRIYVYEAAKVRSRDGTWIEELVRYIGPEDPRYGNRGPIDASSERAALKKRSEARKPAPD